MPWIQLSLLTSKEGAPSTEAAMLESGAESVTLLDAEDQPIHEPAPGETPLWDAIKVTGLYQTNVDIGATIQVICNATGRQPHDIEKTELEDQVWERAWLDQFQPMQFGERLWVCPSTIDPPAPNSVNIMLDPGLAFGTGTHPTTALCLTWLGEQAMKNKTVIDYGSGSGILGIGAAKLGAKVVHCTDNDPQAMLSTRDNANRNHIDPKVLITHPCENFPPLQADILIANILAKPLIELVDCFRQLIKPGGLIALSGILASHVDEVIEAYAPYFTLEPKRQQEDWILLCGSKIDHV